MTRTALRSILLAATALAVLGAVLVVVGLSQGSGPPTADAGRVAATAPAGSAAPTGSAAPPATSAVPETARPTRTTAPPVALAIPAIGVSTPVNQVGLEPDGALEVPQPGPLYDQAAWYRGSPTPGSAGPSVIIGHVDSARDGPSVFYDLGRLRPGDEATVTLADDTRRVFVVERVRTVPKAEFPRLEVYGATPDAELRLITCGGDFDSDAGHYEDNTIVFGRLTDG